MEKSYLDGNNNIRRCHMLLVGHYGRKSGGPPVWAHATGTYIRYYSGAGIQVTPLIQDIHSSRVYYDPPFSFMGGAPEFSNLRPRMTPERKLERAMVESVVNFIFLKSGRLVQALDLDNPDMLGNFKRACKNFARHRRTNGTANRALHEQLFKINADNAAVQQQGQRLAAIEGDLGLAYRDRNPTAVVPAKRSIADLAEDASNILPQGEQNIHSLYGV
jgi:hypothetical protein